ncbi:MAG: serine/threonine-protein kinase [Actinomycetota bacterium]
MTGEDVPDLGSDRYRITGRLGAGAFAAVYLATDDRLATPVAVKVLDARYRSDPEVRGRFVQEARLQRGIRHPGVVTVHDIAETTDGRPYYVMDYADRGTLADRMEQQLAAGAQPATEQVVRLVEELAAALEAVHATGVVHRDLKPSNILVVGVDGAPDRPPGSGELFDENEHVQISDFGLAKDLMAASGLTAGAGTHGYMAPEQSAAAAIVDRRADLYAASVIVAEVLTGERVDPELRYSGGSVLTGSPLPGRTPQAFTTFFATSVDVDPDRRPDDAGTWADGMVAALQAEDRSGGPVSGGGRSRPQRALFIGALVLVAAVAAGLALTLAGRGDSADSSQAGDVPEEDPAGDVPEEDPAGIDLDAIDVVGPEVLAVGEKSWFWADVPSDVTATWEYAGASYDSRELWIQPGGREPSAVRLTLTTGETSATRLLRIPVIERSEEDWACALVPLDVLADALGVESVPTPVLNGFINECVYETDELFIRIGWHRAGAAEALWQQLGSMSDRFAPDDSVGDRAVVAADPALQEVFAVRDDGDEPQGVRVELSGPADDGTGLRLAELLLARTGAEVERALPAEVEVPRTDLPRACSVFTAAEVEASLGRTVAVRYAGPDSICEYVVNDTTFTTRLQIAVADSTVMPVDDVQVPGAEFEDLDGLGDQAALLDSPIGSAVLTRLDDRILMVFLATDDPELDARAQVLDLAELGLNRLPGLL